MRNIDALSRYEEFRDQCLPIVEAMLRKGLSRKDIEKDPRIQAALAAKQVTIGLTEPDSAKALMAIRDFWDRVDGKPVARQEVRAKIEEASDDAINARLKTLLAGSIS